MERMTFQQKEHTIKGYINSGQNLINAMLGEVCESRVFSEIEVQASQIWFMLVFCPPYGDFEDSVGSVLNMLNKAECVSNEQLEIYSRRSSPIQAPHIGKVPTLNKIISNTEEQVEAFCYNNYSYFAVWFSSSREQSVESLGNLHGAKRQLEKFSLAAITCRTFLVITKIK